MGYTSPGSLSRAGGKGTRVREKLVYWHNACRQAIMSKIGDIGSNKTVARVWLISRRVLVEIGLVQGEI